MTAFLVTATRGRHQHKSVVHGDIAAWMSDRNVKTTKRGYTCKGWRLDIKPVSLRALEIAGAILGTRQCERPA